jgi:enoyl-CoA hydratase
MEIVLTGDPIPAERAYDFGLVNEVVDEGEALDAALAMAERICANAPIAVRESRAVVLAADVEDDDTLWKMSGRAMKRLMETEDFAEGPRAFIEKRPPSWKGR